MTPAALRIGAAVRQADLPAMPDLARRQRAARPLALPWVGHAQTRSRGTVCGSIAHADPSAELPLVLLALRRRRCICARAGGAGDVPADAVLHRHDGDRPRRMTS